LDTAQLFCQTFTILSSRFLEYEEKRKAIAKGGGSGNPLWQLPAQHRVVPAFCIFREVRQYGLPAGFSSVLGFSKLQIDRERPNPRSSSAAGNALGSAGIAISDRFQ